MTRIKTLLLLNSILIIGLLFSACKGSRSMKKEAYLDPYLQDSIPYTLAQHEEVSERLFIFLPPALDTVRFEETKLYKKLYKSGYDILCAYQAPAVGAYYYSRKSMEFKGQHIQNVQSLISHLRQQKRIAGAQHTVLMGLEQGAYMLPLLMSNNGIDTAIFINASPFSMYMSLQRIAEGKMAWTEARQKYIKAKFDIDSLGVFKEKVADVERLSSEVFSLGAFPNVFWLSYHANYMLEEYRQNAGHCFWIQFDDYPLYKESDFEYLKLLDQTRNKGSAEYRLHSNYEAYSPSNWDQIEADVLELMLRE